jgi:cytochrome c peroxidase
LVVRAHAATNMPACPIRVNPPSLRGVSQGRAFFHDGRATTLKEVFTRHRHQLKAELSRENLDDLLASLESL